MRVVKSQRLTSSQKQILNVGIKAFLYTNVFLILETIKFLNKLYKNVIKYREDWTEQNHIWIKCINMNNLNQ